MTDGGKKRKSVDDGPDDDAIGPKRQRAGSSSNSGSNSNSDGKASADRRAVVDPNALMVVSWNQMKIKDPSHTFQYLTGLFGEFGWEIICIQEPMPCFKNADPWKTWRCCYVKETDCAFVWNTKTVNVCLSDKQVPLLYSPLPKGYERRLLVGTFQKGKAEPVTICTLHSPYQNASMAGPFWESACAVLLPFKVHMILGDTNLYCPHRPSHPRSTTNLGKLSLSCVLASPTGQRGTLHANDKTSCLDQIYVTDALKSCGTFGRMRVINKGADHIAKIQDLSAEDLASGCCTDMNLAFAGADGKARECLVDADHLMIFAMLAMKHAGAKSMDTKPDSKAVDAVTRFKEIKAMRQGSLEETMLAIQAAEQLMNTPKLSREIRSEIGRWIESVKDTMHKHL